jgi:hypothetical protein
VIPAVEEPRLAELSWKYGLEPEETLAQKPEDPALSVNV